MANIDQVVQDVEVGLREVLLCLLDQMNHVTSSICGVIQELEALHLQFLANVLKLSVPVLLSNGCRKDHIFSCYIENGKGMASDLFQSKDLIPDTKLMQFKELLGATDSIKSECVCSRAPVDVSDHSSKGICRCVLHLKHLPLVLHCPKN